MKINASRARWATLMFALFLWALGAQAEEIWIANKPFAGQVIKDAGQTWVELAPFAKALKVSSAVEGSNATIDGKPVPSQMRGEVVLVPLKEGATAAGAILRDNKSMGIVDVFKGVEQQDPSALTASAESGASGDGKLLKMAAFVVSLPPDMQVTRDAKVLQAAGLGAMKSGEEFREKYGVKESSEIVFDAMLFHKGDTEFKKGFGALAYSAIDLPPNSVPADQVSGIQVAALQLVAKELGVTPSAPVSELKIGGQTFGLLEGDMPAKGLQMKMLLRMDLQRKRQYLVLAMYPFGNSAAGEAFMRTFQTLQTR